MWRKLYCDNFETIHNSRERGDIYHFIHMKLFYNSYGSALYSFHFKNLTKPFSLLAILRQFILANFSYLLFCITLPFALNLISGQMVLTTGNCAFAVCPEICRVLNLGHTENVVFAVCRPKTKAAHGKEKAHGILASLTWASRGNTRWKFSTRRTHAFAVWQKSNTRQTHVLPCALVEHTANMWEKIWICPPKFFC